MRFHIDYFTVPTCRSLPTCTLKVDCNGHFFLIHAKADFGLPESSVFSGDGLMPPSPAVQGCKDPFHNAGRQKQGESLSCSKCQCRDWFYYCQLLLHLHLLQLMPQQFHFHLAPPFPLRLVRREKGRCLEIPFEILPVRHRFIKAMTVRACTHLYQPCHHIKGKNEKEFQRGALIHPFPYFSVHTRMHARAHTHLPSLETNGLLLRPLVRSCAAGKTCTIPHCAQRWTTESATPISAISLENNEAATQGLWNGPIKGQDSLPRHGASWPKDKRVLSLIRVAADKSAFPMRSITATGSEPLSTPLSWLSVMKPPDTDKTSARTNVALVLFFFFFEGWLSSVCSEVAQNWSDMTNSPHGSGRYWDR